MEVLCKFDQLRNKTDKQLIQIIISELDSGLRSAVEALQSDNFASAEELAIKANRAYKKACRLMFLVDELRDHELFAVECRLDRLREMLGALERRRANAQDESEIFTPVGAC